MYDSRRYGDADRFTQKRGLLGDSLDEVDASAGGLGHDASQHDAGKAAAAAEVGPAFCTGREIDELERIGDVPGPEGGQRRGRDQIRLGLPLPQQRDVAIEPGFGFT